MPPRILGPRDYFSDRTLGDTMVQGMQIKGMRSQMADAEARRARMPQEQRMRDMREASFGRQADIASAQDEAFTSRYGGDRVAAEKAKLDEAKRKRELTAVGSGLGLVKQIAETQGVDYADVFAEELIRTSPEFRKYFPGGLKVELQQGKAKTMTHEAMNDTQDVKGNKIKKGSTIISGLNEKGVPSRVLGMKSGPKAKKPEKPARTREKAEEQKVLLTGKLHTLDSNVMAYAGDPTAYRQSLVQALEHNNQFLPEGKKWKPKQEASPPAPAPAPAQPEWQRYQ